MLRAHVLLNFLKKLYEKKYQNLMKRHRLCSLSGEFASWWRNGSIGFRFDPQHGLSDRCR